MSSAFENKRNSRRHNDSKSHFSESRDLPDRAGDPYQIRRHSSIHERKKYFGFFVSDKFFFVLSSQQ